MGKKSEYLNMFIKKIALDNGDKIAVYQEGDKIISARHQIGGRTGNYYAKKENITELIYGKIQL